MLRTLTLALAFATCAAILSAQAIDPDTFKVNYFVDPSDTVHLTNVGTSGGNVCADIFVFDPSQEIVACCSCKETPDGLRTINVGTNLVDNTLTGAIPTKGTIKVVSASTTASNACPLPTAPKPAPGVHAWGTHLQSSGSETETDFQDSGLSATELSNLGAGCSAIKLVGSGKGVCSCGTGD